MKNKRTYSLTAKERKALRNGVGRGGKSKQSSDGKKVGVSSDGSALAAMEAEMLDGQKRSRRSAALIGIVIAVAIVLILSAILVPVIMLVTNPYRGYSDVIARFRLSNGMTLEYVIEENKYDIAATNFIFLAENGYFDNTVFFDAQNGWLRFGGYESQPSTSTTSSSSYDRTRHRMNNQAFCESFTALPNNRFDGWKDKFGYRLRSDSDGTNTALLERVGVLAYLYSDTSTEFQFSYTEQASNQITRRDSGGKEYTNTLTPTMVGRALDEKTIENIIAISATAEVNKTITTGYVWKPPTPNIYIESVKVYNLKGSKWDKFDFITYMNANDSSGRRRLDRWVGQI